MNDNLEEFIRRAAERRRQMEKPATRPIPPEIEILDQIIEADVVPHDVDGRDVTESVHQHLDSTEFTQRAAHLGEAVEQADENLETRLHSVFDHEVAHLKTTSSDASAKDPKAEDKKKSDLAIILSAPESIRKAIILAEIFGRPRYDW